METIDRKYTYAIFIDYKNIVQQGNILFSAFVPLCVNKRCLYRRTNALFKTFSVFLDYIKPLHYTFFTLRELRLNNIVLSLIGLF